MRGGRSKIVYVGNLPNDIRERDLEDLFSKYGRIRSVDIKSPARPPAFAFVEFDDARDAEDAIRGRDGYDFYGSRLRCEFAKGPSGPPPVPQTFRGRGTGYRCLVKNLPMSASWQDLKDHFRKVVTPAFTNVYRDRGGIVGVVEFDTREDLDRAIRKLDDTEFKNPFDRAYVRLVDQSDSKDRARSYSRSRSPRRSASRSRSRSASRGRSPGSRSRSPPRKGSRDRSPADRSRSPVRSPERSPVRSRSRSRDSRD